MVWSDMWGVTIGKQVRLHPSERRRKGPSKRSHRLIPPIPRKFKDLVPSRNNRNRQSSIGSRPLFAGRTQIHCCSYGHRTSHLEGGHAEIDRMGWDLTRRGCRPTLNTPASAGDACEWDIQPTHLDRNDFTPLTVHHLCEKWGTCSRGGDCIRKECDSEADRDNAAVSRKAGERSDLFQNTESGSVCLLYIGFQQNHGRSHR